MRRPVLPVLLAALAAPAAADKLDKEHKKFLEDVSAIILPEEERIYRDLKKDDRAEFEKIFWARRDPDLDTPANEFRPRFEKLRAEADAKFRAGRPGSQTDCGRFHILVGEPDQTRKVGEGQQWVYQDRAASADRPSFTFKGGKMEVQFDATCMVPQGSRMTEPLNRVAEGLIHWPNLKYPLVSGRLTKLADQLPKPTPAKALLKEQRQDFPAANDVKLMLRTPEGGSTYVAGLLRGGPGTLPGDAKAARVVVAAQAVMDTGKVAATHERESALEVSADGAWSVSYGFVLKPGKYTLHVGALEPKSGKGSALTGELVIPDFAADTALGPLLVLLDTPPPTGADPLDPLAAFTFSNGTVRLVPRFGNVFSPSDSVNLLAALYNPKVDEATGKPSLTASFRIEKAGKAIARAEDQQSDSADRSFAVGPVPLANYEPGTYVAHVRVRDNVAQKDHLAEAKFEVK